VVSMSSVWKQGKVFRKAIFIIELINKLFRWGEQGIEPRKLGQPIRGYFPSWPSALAQRLPLPPSPHIRACRAQAD